MKATVYRIEHKECGRGMYHGGCGLYEIAERMGDSIWGETRHPRPTDDSALMATEIPKDIWGNGLEVNHLNFGFSSVEQLRSWLYKDAWLLGLHEAGYVLAIIESEEVYVGSTQAVFLRPPVYQTVSIKDYFNL